MKAYHGPRRRLDYRRAREAFTNKGPGADCDLLDSFRMHRRHGRNPSGTPLLRGLGIPRESRSYGYTRLIRNVYNIAGDQR